MNNGQTYNNNGTARRFPLTDSMIDRLVNDIKKNLGLDVENVYADEDGYLFVGKHKVVLGTVAYDSTRNSYGRLCIQTNAAEEIQKREEALRQGHVERTVQRPVHHRPQPTQQRPQQQSTQRRTQSNQPNTMQRSQKRPKFKLQKGKRIGVALTAAAILALASVGAISIISNANDVTPPKELVGYTIGQRNTVVDASDLILYSWAQYAMDYVDDMSLTLSDADRQLASDIRENFYDQILLNYDSYMDQIECGLPDEVIGRIKQQYQIAFRTNCYLLDESLEKSVYAQATFNESPYSEALVFAASGDLAVSNGLHGELYDRNGNILLPGPNTSEYRLFVRAIDVPNHDYTIENFPADTIVVDGEAFVLEEHLDDFELVSTMGRK